jgi:lysophospholipase L1-like esterase
MSRLAWRVEYVSSPSSPTMLIEPSHSTRLYATLFAVAALGLVAFAARPGDRVTLRAMLRPGPTVGTARSAPIVAAAFAPAVETLLPPPWVPLLRGAVSDVAHLDNPTLQGADGRALDAFARRLAGLASATAPLRVLHFGDSIIADDRITGRLRRRLQREFGDGGLGLVFLRPTARSYHPAGVRFDARGWYPGSVVGPRWDDGCYGVGGTGFEAPGEGPTATLTFDRGRTFELRYLRDPLGGAVSLRLDDEPARTARVDGVIPALIAANDGPHRVTVRAAGGKVRLYGVVATRMGPGVTVDNLGTVSNSARALLHLDAAHWSAGLAAEDPALVIISLGTNEASHGAMSSVDREALYRDAGELYRRIRRALPQASCLVVGPPDAALVLSDGTIGARPALAGIVDVEARAARSEGCAFFDAMAWMGGRGAIQRWQRQGLADSDLTHLTDAGGARIGDAIADALLSARDEASARGVR